MADNQQQRIALRKKLTEQLVALQQQTPEQPYSIPHRLRLAKAYRKLGYPDLAAGDAYKALLLIDEVAEEGEYHDEAIEAANADYLPETTAKLTVDSESESEPEPEPRENEAKTEDDIQVVVWAQTRWSRTAHDILIACLLDCGCLRSAFDYVARATKAFPDEAIFRAHDKALTAKLNAYFEAKGEKLDDIDVDDFPDQGLVRRENYAWNKFEPDRFSDDVLQFLNEEMAAVAPKLEVKVSKLPLLSATADANEEPKFVNQLGVFAKEDITPGDQILEEKSLLTAVSRLHDTFCDACSAKLPDTAAGDTTDSSPIVTCDECDEIYFCSETCHDLAQDTYHPSLCGIRVDSGKVPAREAADALYALLVVRALALAETQDAHPLELKEVRYIWGDYHTAELDTTWDNAAGAFAGLPTTLTFSFNRNVLGMLHMLEKMEVNIFTQSHRYDTWVFNTIFAKLRGTASARQGVDGRPEIGAVHPLWCLANHSCDPNVAWEWQGSMKFWAREQLVPWEGREAGKGPGLKKGEEVFGHYCDVTLPVKERREWAVGALGGDCMCERCVWEAQRQ